MLTKTYNVHKFEYRLDKQNGEKNRHVNRLTICAIVVFRDASKRLQEIRFRGRRLRLCVTRGFIHQMMRLKSLRRIRFYFCSAVILCF